MGGLERAPQAPRARRAPGLPGHSSIPRQAPSGRHGRGLLSGGRGEGNEAIPESLTGAKGDPARGRAIVANRQVGLCLLCHSGPFPEERFQGNLAPSLAGAGTRWSEGQLRLRIVDSGRFNPTTIMPAYYRTEGLVRVAPAWRGKSILSAEQIEDVVAFLVTLKD